MFTRRLRTARALALCVMLAALAACDWTGYLGGPEHHSSSADDTIGVTDVPNLVPQWSWRPRDVDGEPGSLFASPVTFGNRLFVGANIGDFVAVDMTTGEQLWSRYFGFQPSIVCPAMGIVSTAAVRDDGNGNPLVYVNAPDGYLYELDGRTGATVWRSVVQIPSTTENDAFSWSSPTVANGRVYVGVSSNCDTPFVRGAVKAYDEQTGALLATAWTMPTGNVGAGVWTSVAADAGGVYVTIGSTYGDVNDAHPATATNEFDQYSMMKFDPTTLAAKGKWVAPAANSLGDPDFGSSPILFSATIGGATVPMMGACNKDGNFYAVRSDTMQLVWQRTVGTAMDDGQSACLSGGVWDGSRLFVAGNETKVGGRTVPGSVRRLDPATGAVRWTTALGANPLGSGSINAKGILAYTGTDWSGGSGNGTYLLNAANGNVIRVLEDNDFPGFAQPIWAGGRVIVTNADNVSAWSK
ncbi:MAG: outer membrane protein assembly factor BamB family protein [Acidimicrobiia bacterium]